MSILGLNLVRSGSHRARGSWYELPRSSKGGTVGPCRGDVARSSHSSLARGLPPVMVAGRLSPRLLYSMKISADGIYPPPRARCFEPEWKRLHHTILDIIDIRVYPSLCNLYSRQLLVATQVRV